MHHDRVTGVTAEGYKASHRLPAADKKRKHTEQPEKKLHISRTLQLMKAYVRLEEGVNSHTMI